MNNLNNNSTVKFCEKNYTSGSVSRVGYLENEKILSVEFAKKSLYHYFEVPEKVWLGLFKAPSAGKFLEANIKGVYQYKKIK